MHKPVGGTRDSNNHPHLSWPCQALCWLREENLGWDNPPEQRPCSAPWWRAAEVQVQWLRAGGGEESWRLASDQLPCSCCLSSCPQCSKMVWQKSSCRCDHEIGAQLCRLVCAWAAAALCGWAASTLSIHQPTLSIRPITPSELSSLAKAAQNWKPLFVTPPAAWEGEEKQAHLFFTKVFIVFFLVDKK